MAFILSCKPGEDGPDAIIGNSISVPNEVTTVQTSLEFDSDWTLENRASWFVVTPMRRQRGDGQSDYLHSGNKFRTKGKSRKFRRDGQRHRDPVLRVPGRYPRL